MRLRLSIDQRQLPRLLIACANSELTVEVRQVRLNPTDDGSLSLMGGLPGGESSRIPGRESYGPSRELGLGPMGALGPMGEADAAFSQFPYDVTAEIYGIVYLYNPVDKRALGIEEPAADAEIDPGAVTMR